MDDLEQIEMDIKMCNECIEDINKDLSKAQSKRQLLLIERLKIKNELINKKYS